MLKTDQSFVSSIGVKDKDEAIVRTIIGMTSSLGMTVLAECVETQSQRDSPLHHGGTLYQGYLFERPLPAAQLEAEWVGR
jgi:EAL domain-containing protein (putative c-di-GMP-specific phosphodiesterase class I)